MLEVVREARVLAVGARTVDAALVGLERQNVALVLVAEDFDGGRARDVARAGVGRRCILVTATGRALARAETQRFADALAWPFVAEDITDLLAAARSER